ncbi:MAG: beta-phosphoglucomutase family hydrolase [Terracoccus sp.]
MNWGEYDAALFDLDGVLTPTAEVHKRAWGQMFSEYLDGRGIAEPYTSDDYFAHIDGKPRFDGVRDFLASRGISLPEGTPDDAPERETVCGLGNRKNAVFSAILHDEGVEPYAASVRLLDHLTQKGIAMAVVSSSRNAATVLAAAGLEPRFLVVVDGVTAVREGLDGKPSPATYLRAADLLGVTAARSVVFEDALSGVASGRAGEFGLVVGVDRGVGAQPLLEAGADLAVADLDELIPGPVHRRVTS